MIIRKKKKKVNKKHKILTFSLFFIIIIRVKNKIKLFHNL